MLRRLGQGPLDDERSYLLRVVYTVGARLLADRRLVVSLEQLTGERSLDLSADRATVRTTPRRTWWPARRPMRCGG